MRLGMPSGFNYGLSAARLLRTQFAAKSAPQSWEAFIDAQNWDDPDAIKASMSAMTKAAVGASDGDAALLHSPVGDDFAAALRAVTVFDKLGGRKVPLHTRLIDGSAARAYWFAESKPIPLTRSELTGSTLEPKKVAALIVVPNSVFTDPSADAEERFSQDLVNAAAEALDGALLDPSNTGSPGKPAAITNGGTILVSSGSTLANIDADLERMLDAVADAGSGMERATWIMRPHTAIHLSLMRGTGGAPAYPAITAAGGELLGLRVLTSAGVPAEGSPSESSIILVDADDFVYGDQGASVSLSDQAMIEMSDTPTGATDTPVAATQFLVSMFQEDCTAVKVVRRCSWTMRKPTVATLTDVAY